MGMRNYSMLLLILALLITLGVWTYRVSSRTARLGFVVNQVVFDKFNGKKRLEEKLKAVQDKHKNTLDSLGAMLQMHYQTDLVNQYQQTSNRYAQEERELSEQYTADIWKEINQYVVDYGKQSGYDFIYGAVGNGSLMYGHEAFDITEDVVAFINEKYEGQ